MGDKISKNIIVVIVSFISAIVGIFAFATGKNFPDFFDSSSYSNDLSTEKVEEHSSSQNWPNSMENDIDFDFIKGDDRTITQNIPGEDHTAQQTDNYELTGSAVHFPNVLSGDYIIGGVWKLQGIHEAAHSFSQSVEVYSLSSPDQIMYYGAASYDMVWSECEDGTYAEIPSDFDQITQYDYPSGTYGTFCVDLSSPPITEGKYECRLLLYINEVCYTHTIPFEI